MKTVLITGCSSGYGLETARHFHAQGWNVVATMRTPREDVLPRSDRLRVVALDVTKAERIAAAPEAGRGGECDLERDADADAAGGSVHREQDGHRRVHRITRARARGVQRAGQ